MIKSFNDFFKENKQKVNESAEAVSNEMFDDSVVFDNKDLENVKDFVAPNLVSDDRFLSKIGVIIVRRLNKNTSTSFTINPFIVEVNGNKCALIVSDSMCIAAFRNGITKTVVLYNGNPLDGVEKHEFVLTTSKLGFKDLIDTLIMFISANGGSVNEALTEIAPPTAIPNMPFGPICKAIKKIPEDSMHAFLKQYETMTDLEILNSLLEAAKRGGAYPDGIDVCMETFGYTDRTGINRLVCAIHCILCAESSIGTNDKMKEEIRNVWFYGAGASGKLGIEITSDGRYIVEEPSSMLDKGIDELQNNMDEVYEIANAMCSYIKSDGKDIETLQSTISNYRGLIITGKAGIGKTYSLNKSIKENGMREGLDYMKFSGSSMGANRTYKDLYDGNNMLLIFDDNPDMFNGSLKVGLWKIATDPDDINRNVSKPTGGAGEKSAIFYDSDKPDMTRQQRYFAEVGKLSPYDKEKWIKNKIKQLKAATTAKSGRKGSGETDEKVLRSWALKEYKDYEENELMPLMPTKFHFDGLVVYICNDTLGVFRNQVKDSWEAIQSRFYIVDISPTNRIIWAWLKKKIKTDAADSSKPDELKLMPTTSKCEGYTLDKFLTFIDDIMSGKYNTETKTYGYMNYRILSNLRTFIATGARRWEDKILKAMLVDVKREG